MRLFVHIACTAMLGWVVMACGPSDRPHHPPATTAENFGVRSVDPWDDQTDSTSEQPQGRRVYVPEPRPEQGAQTGHNADQQGHATDPTPAPASNDTSDDDPDGNSGDDANDPVNTDDDPPNGQSPPPARPQGIQGRFTFNDAASLLYVQVFKDENTLGARFAHNHAIRATGWQGALERNGDGSDCTVNLELPVAGLVPDETAMRRRVGYSDDISADQRQEIRGHMLAANQLNSDAHPTMSFRGTRCTGADSDRGRMLVEGQMTIRGVAKAVRINLEYRLLDGLLYLRGELGITHRDFGFAPYSAFAGSVRNQEPMTLGFDFQSTATN